MVVVQSIYYLLKLNNFFTILGIKFFRERIHDKLMELFVFDERHYIAMCLHPALREMGTKNTYFVILA